MSAARGPAEDPTTYVVPAEAAGQRLDRWLAAQPDAPTRSQIASALSRGEITVDGSAAKASLKLRGGETIAASIKPAPPSETLVPQDIDIDVLHVDDDVLAINKAAGMVVHPAAGNRDGTLVNAILHAYPPEEGGLDRAGIVHRLDRDTSGVILIARNVAAHEALAKQFRARTIKKEYAAVVRGNVDAPGEIDAPLGRHPRDRKRMSVAANQARSALTRYEVEETFGGFASWLRAMPHTGRTHQIRVHLASKGWPIIGDKVYGPATDKIWARARRQWGTRVDAAKAMKRQALHARRIAFEHPRTGVPMALEAPLPADMTALIEGLRGAG